jgi:hypothetical protein
MLTHIPLNVINLILQTTLQVKEVHEVEYLDKYYQNFKV